MRTCTCRITKEEYKEKIQRLYDFDDPNFFNENNQ